MPLLTTKRKIALLRHLQRLMLALRRVFGFGPRIEVRRSGFRWFLDLNQETDFLLYAMGALGTRKLAAYQNFIHLGAIVLDLGANIGRHTFPLAHLVGPTGHVFAFEPRKQPSERFQKTLALNPEVASRITFVAGAYPGAIAGFLAKKGVTDVDYVRLALSGEECAILREMVQMLKTSRPLMQFALAPDCLQRAGESLSSLLAILSGAGYVLTDARRGVTLAMNERALRNWIPEGAKRNVIAIPEELLDSL